MELQRAQILGEVPTVRTNKPIYQYFMNLTKGAVSAHFIFVMDSNNFKQ